MRRVPTRISVLDELIGGGLPKPLTLGILGDSGSGKSVFCYQLTWNLLQQGFYVLYYATDESVDEVKDNMSAFSWDVTPYEEKGMLKFVDVFSKGMETIVRGKPEEVTISPDQVTKISFDFRWMVSEGKNFYLRAVAGKDLLVIYDSLTTLFLSVEDPRKALQFVQHLKYASRVCKAIGVATLQLGVHDKEIENACRHYADGIIEMRCREEGGYLYRYLRIDKMRATTFLEDYFLMEIKDSGIVLHKVPIKMPIKFEERSDNRIKT